MSFLFTCDIIKAMTTLKLKLKQYKLSPKDNLPKKIEAPEELIKKIIRKIIINKNTDNVKNCLIWTPLAEKILKRYSSINEELTVNLQLGLAKIFLNYKCDYEKARKYYYKSYTMLKRINGEEDKDTVRCLANLSTSLFEVNIVNY